MLLVNFFEVFINQFLRIWQLQTLVCLNVLNIMVELETVRLRFFILGSLGSKLIAEANLNIAIVMQTFENLSYSPKLFNRYNIAHTWSLGMCN